MWQAKSQCAELGVQIISCRCGSRNESITWMIRQSIDLFLELFAVGRNERYTLPRGAF